MSEFDKYLKEKNIKMTTDDYNFCISCIQDDVRVIAMRPRQMNKAFLNGLIIDFKFWCKEQENTELKKKQKELCDKIQELLLVEDNYIRFQEKYDYLESRHELIVQENLKFEQENTELKKKLENAIVPKFRPRQKFYYINEFNQIVERHIICIVLRQSCIVYVDENGTNWECDYGKETEREFYTKEEAEQRLKELKGGS